MIYMNDRQFKSFKSNLASALALMGTGVKGRKADDLSAQLLGFADYRTYHAIGRLPSEIDNGDMTHTDHIGFCIDGGSVVGALADCKEIQPWWISLDGEVLVNAEAYFASNDPRALEDAATDWLNALFGDWAWCTKIGDAFHKGEWSGTLVDKSGKQHTWEVECPYVEVGVETLSELPMHDVALIAGNVDAQYRGMIGSKHADVIAALLPETPRNVIKEGVEQMFAPSIKQGYIDRHRAIKGFIKSKDMQSYRKALASFS